MHVSLVQFLHSHWAGRNAWNFTWIQTPNETTHHKSPSPIVWHSAIGSVDCCCSQIQGAPHGFMPLKMHWSLSHQTLPRTIVATPKWATQRTKSDAKRYSALRYSARARARAHSNREKAKPNELAQSVTNVSHIANVSAAHSLLIYGMLRNLVDPMGLENYIAASQIRINAEPIVRSLLNLWPPSFGECKSYGLAKLHKSSRSTVLVDALRPLWP